MYFRLIGVPDSLNVDDGIAQEDPDVTELDVSRRVPFVVPGHQILTRPLGDDDDGVAAALEPLAQRGEQPLERERNLGHEAEVDLAIDEHAVRGDEARVAAHQLHEADAVARALGLGVGGVGRPPASVTAVSNPNVFWTNEMSLSIVFGTPMTAIARPCRSPPRDRMRAAQRAVAADREQDAHAELAQVVDHGGRVLRTARRAEDRAADVVDAAHHVGGQLQRFVTGRLDQALEAEAEPVDRPTP